MNNVITDKNIEIKQTDNYQISNKDSIHHVISYEANANNQNIWPCKFCNKVYKSSQSRHKHIQNVHKDKLNEISSDEMNKLDYAAKSILFP